MAATTAFPSLSVPQEDSMDMSSPANQAYDTDIDLDFGDGEYDGGVTLQEDEQMLTDGEQTRPQTATDEMMDDDAQIDQQHLQEKVMQDSSDIEQPQTAQQDDEELIDYGDDEYFDHQQGEDTTLVNANEAYNEPHAQEEEQVDEEIERQPEDVGFEQPQPLDVPEAGPADFVPAVDSACADAAQVAAASDVFTEFDGKAAFRAQHHIEPTGDAQANARDGDDFAESATHEELAGANEDTAQATEPMTTKNLAAQPALTVETTTYAENDAPGTPTDTGLHPMTLYYGDLCWPLFKSKNQSDGLLKDDNLASLSLHELMRNCRQQLALKIGNIPEEQDFTLAFDHMGLMLVENSRAAFAHSLNDVLEIYLQLHHNDGIEDCPPLSLTLTRQQFSNQLAVLKHAAVVGKGMSDFAAVEHEEDEQEYEGGARGESHSTGEEAGGYDEQQERYEEAAAGDEQGYQDDAAYYGQEYPEDAQEASGDHSEMTVTEQQQPTTEDSIPSEAGVGEQYADAGDATPPAAESAAHDDQTDHLLATKEPSVHVFDAEGPRVATADEPDATAEDALDEDENTPSTTSSQTVCGDDAKGNTDAAAVDVVDDKDDCSAFLNEFNGEEAQAAEQPVDQAAATEQADGVATQHDATDQGTGEAFEQAAAADHWRQYLGSEELHGEHAEHQDGTDAHEGTHSEVNADEAAQYQERYDQADIDDEQYQVSFQPGGEEQFRTAHDFLPRGDYEHGLEHIRNGEDYIGDDAANPEKTEYEEDPGQLDLGDDIGFDDETTEEYQARKASQSRVIAAADSDSPLGKRSFDEGADDEFGLDKPEAKKVRAE